MSDTEHSEKREEPSGTSLSVEEWIEVLNKHDRFDQYAKRRREKREKGTDDE
jgi:dihydrodipicolinate reductase